MRMRYGVATDDGRALVRRALIDRGSGPIEVVRAQHVQVPQPGRLGQMNTRRPAVLSTRLRVSPADVRPRLKVGGRIHGGMRC